jgi:molybdopterin-guanine dinucleotide biosynthesis protein A
MNCAGFVLAGGKSSRMGSDKALLPFKGRALVQHVAEQVHQAAGNVKLVGDPGKYSYLGYPVIPDVYAGRGPLSGIHSALCVSRVEWNLIVACDMPELTAGFLTRILARAQAGDAQAVIPVGPSGRPEPLCAAYNRSVLAVTAQALEHGIYKVLAGLEGIQIDRWRIPDSRHFHNLNTPREWARYCHG